MSALYYKGERHYCIKCKSWLFDIAKDVYIHSPINSRIFRGGQHFRDLDQTNCRECGMKWIRSSLFLTHQFGNEYKKEEYL